LTIRFEPTTAVPILLIGTAGLLLSLFTGCSPTPQPPVKVIARVGDRMLTIPELQIWESSLQNQVISTEMRTAFIRNWVDQEILVQASKDIGLDTDPWVEGRLDELHRELLVARYLELDAVNIPPPSLGAVMSYFDQHGSEYVWTKPHLTVQYWRSGSRAPLDRIRGEMTSSRPTPLQPSEIAKIDTGRIEIDDPAILNSTVWKQISWMQPGQLGYPVSIDRTYWMFKVLRHDPAGSRKQLADARDDIVSRLLEEQRTNRRAELTQKLEKEFAADGRLQWSAETTPPAPPTPVRE
jgi:hypothetical protein